MHRSGGLDARASQFLHGVGLHGVSALRAIALVGVLAGFWGLGGCGDPLLIGSQCAGDKPSCVVEEVNPSRGWAGGDCYPVQVAPLQVESGESVEYCAIATIETVRGEGFPAYVTSVEFSAELGTDEGPRPGPQVVSVHHRSRSRWGPAPWLPDGVIECETAIATHEFQPLGVFQHDRDYVFFGTENPNDGRTRSGYPVEHGDQLLFVQRYRNDTNTTVSIQTGLNMTCVRNEPNVVLQQFAFETPGPLVVAPGQERTTEGECVFDRPVELLRLYRQIDERVVSFSAERVNGTGSWRWQAAEPNAWEVVPNPALSMAKGEGLRWSCTYFNDELDSDLAIGSENRPVCAVMGVYQLLDGAADPEPVHCRSPR